MTSAPASGAETTGGLDLSGQPYEAMRPEATAYEATAYKPAAYEAAAYEPAWSAQSMDAPAGDTVAEAPPARFVEWPPEGEPEGDPAAAETPSDDANTRPGEPGDITVWPPRLPGEPYEQPGEDGAEGRPVAFGTSWPPPALYDEDSGPPHDAPHDSTASTARDDTSQHDSMAADGFEDTRSPYDGTPPAAADEASTTGQPPGFEARTEPDAAAGIGAHGDERPSHAGMPDAPAVPYAYGATLSADTGAHDVSGIGRQDAAGAEQPGQTTTGRHGAHARHSAGEVSGRAPQGPGQHNGGRYSPQYGDHDGQSPGSQSHGSRLQGDLSDGGLNQGLPSMSQGANISQGGYVPGQIVPIEDVQGTRAADAQGLPSSYTGHVAENAARPGPADQLSATAQPTPADRLHQPPRPGQPAPTGPTPVMPPGDASSQEISQAITPVEGFALAPAGQPSVAYGAEGGPTDHVPSPNDAAPPLFGSPGAPPNDVPPVGAPSADAPDADASASLPGSHETPSGQMPQTSPPAGSDSPPSPATSSTPFAFTPVTPARAGRPAAPSGFTLAPLPGGDSRADQGLAGSSPLTPATPGGAGGKIKRVLLTACTVVAVGAIGTAAYFAYSVDPGPKPISRPTSATGSAAPSVPQAQADTSSVLDDETTDPRAMTLAEAFPDVKVTLDGRTYRRVKTTLTDHCRDAATGAFAVALNREACSRVLRATYIDGKRDFAITTGIAVLPDKKAALTVDQAKDLNGNVWFRGLDGTRTSGAERVTISGGYAASMIWGRYIVFSYATYADGHTPDAQDRYLGPISGAFRDHMAQVLQKRLTK